MIESICLEESTMINTLDKFCIEKKVRSCFAKSEDMVEEMISKIEREINGDNCFDTLKESQLAKDQLPPYHTDESNDELPWMSH